MTNFNKINKKIVLVSFATQEWSRSLLRMYRQARDANIFYDIFLLDEKKLNNNTGYYELHKDFIQKINNRYGGCIWKPYIVEMAFSKFPEADYFLYLDSGSEFNINENTIDRFLSYFESSDEFGISAMISRSLEEEMTHCSIIDNVYSGSRGSRQFNAGVLFIKNSNNSKNFIEEWKIQNELNEYQNLLPDVNNHCCDKWSGINVLDQSVFSCLMKKHKFTGILDEADWYHDGYNIYMDIEKNKEFYPIFGARNKTSISIIDKCIRYKDQVRHQPFCKEVGQPICNDLIVVREKASSF